METYEETLARMWIEKHTRLAREKAVKEGHKEGHKEGRKEGHREGQQEFVLRQLARRFGALPEAITARVMKAGREELERWSDRIIDGASLNDVFAAP